MADSHAHLKITSKEWEAFLDDFQQTLDKFAVPLREQAELKAIVNTTEQILSSIPHTRKARLSQNSVASNRSRPPTLAIALQGASAAYIVSQPT